MYNSKPAPAEYEVTQAREIGGVHRALGEIVTLTPLQAKYFLPPYGAGLIILGVRKEAIGSLDDPNVKNPQDHATGKPGKAKG